MKNALIFLLAAGLSFTAAAQLSNHPTKVTLKGAPHCGFQQLLDKSHVQYGDLLKAYRSTGKPDAASMARTTGLVYDIPVVVHVVYGPGQQGFNLPDSIIHNQITVLNKAFRKQHADTGNVRNQFKPLSKDAEIQFHLATKDPSGNPTTGITRTLSDRLYFGSADYEFDSLERVKFSAQGGIDPWPTDRYMNIWICNLSDSQGQLAVLGYATPPIPLPNNNWPAGAEQELALLRDGVVLQVHSVGSNNPLSAQLGGLYTKGRCAVHEVGHYLGLQHIFGSNDGDPSTASCGPIADDGIADTPPQSTLSFDSGCPSAAKNSCGAGDPNDLPDMWENYMDYSVDACQALFTQGQIAIMRSVTGDQRSTLFNTVSVAGIPGARSFVLYPNPASQQLSVRYPGQIDRAVVVNFLGQKVLQWEGASARQKNYDISTLAPGHYLLLMETGQQQLTEKFSVVR